MNMGLKTKKPLINEIENHFNKEIVSTLIRFFMDTRLNKNGGTLIFTTHYPELLDEYDRNDSIHIIRNRNGITVDNLANILKRNDIKKSEAYQSGFLEGTTPLYESYMRLKKSIAKSELDFSKIQVGDFIEVDGELQKNPLINYMDIFVDIFRLADIFTEEPQLGNKTQAKTQKQQESKIVKQIKSFSEELKHSGTIDFILSDKRGTLVLSAQEQYLANDNVSEILGGHFKVLGKVISICKDENENIDLLRKTTLSVLSEEMLEEMFSGFKNSDTE